MGLNMKATAAAPILEREVQISVPSPWPNQVQTARALARFLEEAGETLERLVEARARKEQERPGAKEEKDVLAFLARQDDWVELLDLPRTDPLSRDARRRLARRMAEEGVVEIDPTPRYPNMVFLRITPLGREDLHRRRVREAMDILDGGNKGVYTAVAEARRALRRVAELVGVGGQGG